MGEKEKDNARQAVFLTPTNTNGNDLEGEKPHDDYTVPQKVPCVTCWKHNQNAVYCVRLSKAQDQGLEFWQTKSFAIMTFATIPRDCTDRVTAQNGERVLFERLETPRSAPKLTLKRIGNASSSRSPRLTQTYLAFGNGRHTTSNMDVETHLGDKEVSTNAFLKNEAVKEEVAETNTNAIERINICSNQILYSRRPGEGEDGV